MSHSSEVAWLIQSYRLSSWNVFMIGPDREVLNNRCVNLRSRIDSFFDQRFSLGIVSYQHEAGIHLSPRFDNDNDNDMSSIDQTSRCQKIPFVVLVYNCEDVGDKWLRLNMCTLLMWRARLRLLTASISGNMFAKEVPKRDGERENIQQHCLPSINTQREAFERARVINSESIMERSRETLNSDLLSTSRMKDTNETSTWSLSFCCIRIRSPSLVQFVQHLFTDWAQDSGLDELTRTTTASGIYRVFSNDSIQRCFDNYYCPISPLRTTESSFVDALVVRNFWIDSLTIVNVES